jgi:ketosteroid isomerase-like protein
MQHVKDTLSDFLQAFSHLQLEKMMEYVSNDATAYLPVRHRTNLHKGKQKIKDYFKWLHERIRATGVTDMGLVAEDALVQLVGDVAVVTFKIIEDNVLR